MYKRILCALCAAFALLFIIAMVYLIFFYEQSKSQEVKDPPSISIYLDDLHNKSRETISQGADKTVVIDRVQLDLSYIGEKVKRKLLLFVCNASFPIQWKYNGFGSLQGTVHYRKDAQDFQDVQGSVSTGNSYSSVIELSEISEYITGYYECVGFKSTDPVSRIYVFAPDKKNNTFIIKHEEDFQVGYYERFVIPCPVSDPNAKIALIRLRLELKDDLASRVIPKNENSYDPKVGFRFVSITDVVSKDTSPAWGTYACLDENNGHYSALIRVQQPLANFASHSVESVPDKNGTKNSVRVTCTCKENVYFTFTNFHKRPKKYRHPRNESNHIRVRIKPEDFKNDSLIECVTDTSNRILFSWKFRENGILVNGSSDILIDYNSTAKNFSCCSKSNESPTLKLLSCYTEAECQFKLNELKYNSYKNQKLITKLTSQTNESCSVINVEQFPQGLLQCSLDKYTKQIPYYIDGETGKKAPPQNGTDFIIRLEQKSTKRVAKIGNQIRFYCSGPRFFIAQGFQWELQKGKTNSEYLKSNGTENSSKDLKEWIEFIVPFQQVNKVLCYAPVIGSRKYFQCGINGIIVVKYV